MPQKGNWRWIRFNSTAATSTLEGVKIRYGGGGCSMGFCWGAITQSLGVGIEIKNSRIEKNIWGIFSKEADCQTALEKIKIENTVFSDNEINIYLGYNPTCSPP